MSIHWTIIHNPRSCSGKGAKAWPEVERLLRAAEIPFTRLETTYAGHAVTLTRDAIAQGARNIVAMGGDGTVNEVVNGIFSQDTVPPDEILLTQIPVGTGNDWRRTIGVPKTHADCIAVLRDPGEHVQDVGVVDFKTDGAPQRRYFVNVAGMGFEAYVGEVANAQKAAGKGGPLGYYPALIRCLAKYEPVEAGFQVEDTVLPSRRFFSLAIGICKFNGGGMKQCPDALMDDGLLDLTLINEAPKWVIVMNVPRLFTGGFVSIKYVEQHRARHIHVDTGAGTLLEVDGENIGAGPATFSLLPSALRVAVPRM